MPKASSLRTMPPSQRAIQDSNTPHAARIQKTPVMSSQHTRQQRPSTLTHTGSSTASKAAAPQATIWEHHRPCMETVRDLEKDNQHLEKENDDLKKKNSDLQSCTERLENENRGLREQLSEVQNSQPPTQTQQDIQELVQQIEGSLHGLKQRIPGFNTSNPDAMLSIDPNWTQDHGALGSLNDPQLEPNNMLDVNAFY